MRKSKNVILTLLIYAIIIGTYNLIVFVVFDNYTAVFWMSYGFTMLAFVLQIGSLFLSFKKTKTEALLFGTAMLLFSFFYLIVQVCAGFIFMIFRARMDTTAPLITQVVILALFLIVAIIAIMVRDTVTDEDKNKDS